MKDSSGKTWMPFVNTTGSTIPAASVVKCEGGGTTDWGMNYLSVSQFAGPDSDGRYADSPGITLAACTNGSYGMLSFASEPTWARGSGTPGGYVNPSNGSWSLSDSGMSHPSFYVLGTGTLADGEQAVLVVRDDYFTLGCGLTWGNRSVLVNNGDLVAVDSGLRVDATTTCGIEVKPYCGIQVDSNGVWINRSDLIGVGLANGLSTCDIDVDYGCGLTIGGVSGNALVVNPTDLEGEALEASGSGCGLDVLYDDVTIKLNGSNQLYAVGASPDLCLLTEVVFDPAADKIAFCDVSAAAGGRDLWSDMASLIFDGVGSGLLSTNGTVAIDFANLTAGIVDPGADSFAFYDPGLMETRLESLADYADAIAGDGLTATSGVLDVILYELSEAVFDPAADSIPFVDAMDNSSKRDLWSDMAPLIFEPNDSGLRCNSGTVSLYIKDLPDITTFLDSADVFVVEDVSLTSTHSVRRISFGDLVDKISPEIAGNGLQDNSGALDVSNPLTPQISPGALSLDVSVEPTEAEVQSIADKVDSLISALLAAGVLV